MLATVRNGTGAGRKRAKKLPLTWTHSCPRTGDIVVTRGYSCAGCGARRP